MNSNIQTESFLDMVRLCLRMLRVSARLPGGQEGNLLERAFLDSLVGLWRAQIEPELAAGELIKMSVAEAMASYLRAYPEDRTAPAMQGFMPAVELYEQRATPEARLVADGLDGWVKGELDSGSAFADYWSLLEAARRVERAIPIPARPERPENDAEHSVQLALLAWWAHLQAARAGS